MFKIASTPILSVLLLGTALSAPVLAQHTDPSAFTSELRPRYWVGEDETRYALADRMDHYGVPGLAIAIVEDGEIAYSAGFGVLQAGGEAPVDADTMFSVGSVSKVAAATIAMRLSDTGRLDLDQSVSAYLTSWALPETGTYDNDAVTMRAILSHTAGFNLHGFADFQPGETLPTAVQSLNGEAPAQHDPLELLFAPGTEYKYSGGGYTLGQLVLSDLTGQAFEDAASTHLFAPLDLQRSSFENPLPASIGNIARAHNRRGERVALPRGYEAMPEMAASGLWTSANDLGAIVETLIDSYRGGTAFLSRGSALDMMTRVAPSEHGLGPRLDGRADQYVFHHGGMNDSYVAWIEGHLATGDGLVVLTNGRGGNDLAMEVRNAVADVMGWQMNAPIRIPELELSEDHLASFAGVYGVDGDFPLQLRQQMVRWIYESDLEFRVVEGALEVGQPGGGRFEALIPVAPNRFLMPSFAQRLGIAEFEFHRSANGETPAMTFRLSNAESHYARR